MKLYKFEVEWFNDYEEKEENNSGFICANTCSEAVEYLEKNLEVLDLKIQMVNYECNNIVFVDEPVALEVVRKANDY